VKRRLLVFAQRGTDKPRFIETVDVELRDNLLGARDPICLSYSDLEDADELRVVREEEAVKRRWALPSKKSPLYPLSANDESKKDTRRSSPSRSTNPFDE
jgi:hypothetical protein